MSPVLRWTTPYLALISSHCVPFPLAGAPAMISLGGALRPAAADAGAGGAGSDSVSEADAATEATEAPYPRDSDHLVRDSAFRLFLLAPDTTTLAEEPCRRTAAASPARWLARAEGGGATADGWVKKAFAEETRRAIDRMDFIA